MDGLLVSRLAIVPQHILASVGKRIVELEKCNLTSFTPDGINGKLSSVDLQHSVILWLKGNVFVRESIAAREVYLWSYPSSS